MKRLRLTCTDDGQHPSRELAMIEWGPGVPDGGFVVMDAAEADASGEERRSLSARSRVTKAGGTAVTRSSVEMLRRADGGVTYRMTCQSCRRRPLLRDDTIEKIAAVPHDTPTPVTLDTSTRKIV